MAGTSTRSKAGQTQPSGQWIRADLRLAIYLRDRFTCLYCLADLHEAEPSDITLDHVVPRSSWPGGKAGVNAPANLVTACRSCNCSRQDKPLARFAGKEARAHVRRNTRRSIIKYRRLAKELIAGTTGGDENSGQSRTTKATGSRRKPGSR